MNFLSKLIAPRFPTAAVGLERKGAAVVHLERRRKDGFALKRAATVSLPDALLNPDFDESNVADPKELAHALGDAIIGAGLGRQRKWSVTLPEAATRTVILHLESAPGSRSELEEVLRWKTERGFGTPLEELRVAREKLPPDPQGRARYLAVGVREIVLAEYESVFASLGWRAGLILPRHVGEARWLMQANAGLDALLVSSHTDGFTVVLVRARRPLVVRTVLCDAEDRDDELYRLLLFYRDRVASSDEDGSSSGDARNLEQLLVLGEGFDKNHVSEIINETLGRELRPLGPRDVGLTLPPGELDFDTIAAPAGLATLAWK